MLNSVFVTIRKFLENINKIFWAQRCGWASLATFISCPKAYWKQNCSQTLLSFNDKIILRPITHNFKSILAFIPHRTFRESSSSSSSSSKRILAQIFLSFLIPFSWSFHPERHRDANENVISQDEQRFTQDEYFSNFYGLRMGSRDQSKTIPFFRCPGRKPRKQLTTQIFNKLNNYFNAL